MTRASTHTRAPRVDEVCELAVVTAGPRDTVQHAITTLGDLDIRHLPIVDEESGDLIGIVSDRDLRVFSSAFVQTLARAEEIDAALATPLSQIMNGQVITVRGSANLQDAANLMIQHRIGALPVIADGDGALVGILSYIDVLAGR